MALRGDEHEFMNLREWDRRARLIRENPTSRRFSASYVGSFGEDHHKSSSRTYLNSISSTASSPGYTLKDEIDPSTYSFTNALKALQAKTMFNNREWLTQEGFALNSKWNEAEKYICNPVSGEVPMECLSSKTLSARSFRNLTTTMSAPLHYPDPNPLMNNIGQNKPNDNSNVKVIHEDLYAPDPVLVRAEKKVVGLKRDVGIQSTSVDLSSGSPSPAKTPPIMERSLKRHVEPNDSPVDFNLKLEGQQEDLKLEDKEKEGDKQEMSKEETLEKQEVSNTEGEETEDKQEMSIKEGEGEEKQEMSDEEEEEMKKQKKRGGSGCFSWRRSRQSLLQRTRLIGENSSEGPSSSSMGSYVEQARENHVKKKVEEALRSKMKAKALNECDQYVSKYAECATGRTFSVVWTCRKQAKELNTCLHQFTNDKVLEEMKREYMIQEEGKVSASTA